ncbi:hypothetical protein BDEG_21145 [Batrachochytrium dendrobatidis JEL423]|uniref:Aldehyde dehydrogenase domain-containing protein n=1 Tax=Batrachochytrium dendrobatidis (strain JEL423) TaxID=403673 RepID=A0A177WBA7_BATDL|nr:hypothetical protein BDEG_21145 [Batrachochytrium dendrobatidis JEL423]
MVVIELNVLAAFYVLGSVVAIYAIKRIAKALVLCVQPIPKFFVVPPKEADFGWKPSKGPTQISSVRDPKNPAKIICYDPATGYSLGERDIVSPEQVKSIVDKARIAQQIYATTTFEQRRTLLRSLLDWIVDNQDLICRVATRDSGKSLIDGNFGEILTTCEKLRWTIQHGENALRSEVREPGMVMVHKIPRVDYLPIGVMGCIVSWNYPFHNVFGPVVSALMAGNACVVKCSEQVAWSTTFWQSIISAALTANNISEDLVVFMNGFGETGQALVDAADKITFIGSPGVGKIIMKQASHTLTPVILELGGKDCALVFDDCDYEQFRHNSMRYSFQNSGQNCAGLERVIIHESLYDRYISDTIETIRKLRVGASLHEEVDCGAITMFSQSLVDDAIKMGAKVQIGGSTYKNPNFPYGQYFTPTLLTGITTKMRISQEEIFGPVLMVMKFKTEEEAIALANSSPFGLGSGVFTLDIQKGERVARKLRVGFSNINDFGVNYLCQGLPFAGVGISGIDRFAGVEGLRGNCHPRAMTSDRFNFMGVRTTLPQLLHYPIVPAGKEFQESLIQMLFALNPVSRVIGLMRVAKISILGHA